MFGLFNHYGKSGSFEEKICCYADQRVDPFGVLSIEERISEGKKCYAGRHDCVLNSEFFDDLFSNLKKLEDQIFEKARIKPEDITDNSITEIIKELKKMAY